MTAAVAEEAFVDKQMVPTHSVMSAGDLHWAPDARKALQIAAELCIYTGWCSTAGASECTCTSVLQLLRHVPAGKTAECTVFCWLVYMPSQARSWPVVSVSHLVNCQSSCMVAMQAVAAADT